jgi:hypothetical protein
MKKFYCEKTGDGEKRTCVYTGTHASTELNTRENGTVWSADIRVFFPIPKEEEEKTYNDALFSYCTALIAQTSGLNFLGALSDWTGQAAGPAMSAMPR